MQVLEVKINSREKYSIALEGSGEGMRTDTGFRRQM